MKLGLAVLPLEVWADVFESPCISRQWLAQLGNRLGNRKFAEKLQKLLHGCGQQTLQYIRICNPNKRLRKREILKFRASLAVAHGYLHRGSVWFKPIYHYKDCEFPQSQMPENIKTFKQLTIKHVDDEVLDFLDKIKTLFTNVFLGIESAPNLRTLFAHFLPMVASIRGINCDSKYVECWRSISLQLWHRPRSWMCSAPNRLPFPHIWTG